MIQETMMSETVQVPIILALIGALAPIATNVVTWLLNRKQMRQQDAVIDKVHTAVNSNYSDLGDRLDKALQIVDELKEEITRINSDGIVTPSAGKRRGDVTMKDGVVETRTERGASE